MEFVEGDLGPGQVLANARAIAGRHVDTEVRDVLGTAAVGLEVIGELGDDLRLAPLAGREQASGDQVVEQADVVVAAACGGLVQAHRRDGGEVLACPGLGDIVVEGTPDTHVADIEQLGHLADGHRLAQGDDQGVHELGEAALGARPGHLDLGGLVAGVTGHPRHFGMDVGFELKEIQMPPDAFAGVVDALVGSAAARTTAELCSTRT